MIYDAAEFLVSLFSPPAHSGLADLSPDWHDRWDERAAIMEFDGGLRREVAEKMALLDVITQMRAGGQLSGPPPA